MKTVDVFNHIYPRKYFDFTEKESLRVQQMSKQLPNLVDMESRIREMDRLGVDMEILSLALPAIDDLRLSPDLTRQVTSFANDSIREVADSHAERFLAIGTVSLSDPEFAIGEATRCVKDLHLLGIQIVSNVNGEPVDLNKFDDFYSAIEKLDVPLWVHPTDMRDSYPWLRDYNTDIMVGWDFDTTLSMIRMVGSGLLKKHNKLKVIVHHLGSLVPLLAGRIAGFLSNMEKDEGKGAMDYLKSFYVDTAEGMWAPWLKTAIDFFGIDHVMFGTDFPWGNSEKILSNIESLEISDSDKEKILYGNASKIIGKI